jgi:hypothetical protein
MNWVAQSGICLRASSIQSLRVKQVGRQRPVPICLAHIDIPQRAPGTKGRSPWIVVVPAAAALICVGNYFRGIFWTLDSTVQASVILVGGLLCFKLLDIAAGRPSKASVLSRPL